MSNDENVRFTLVILSGIVAGLMSWAIGAQDVSNALGTSVGSKALSIKAAIYVGAICEFTGSLVGGSVAGTISSGILNVSMFEGVEGLNEYALLMFSTMGGAFVWLAIATKLSAPVSTTHSLVGSLIGVGFLSKGKEAVQISSLTKIVISWITSPLLGLIISYSIFYSINKLILQNQNPVSAARKYAPYYVGLTLGICCSFILLTGPQMMRTSYSFSLFTFLFVSCLVTTLVKIDFIDYKIVYGRVIEKDYIYKKTANKNYGSSLTPTSPNSPLSSASSSSSFIDVSVVNNVITTTSPRGRGGKTKIKTPPVSPPRLSNKKEDDDIDAELFFKRLMVLTAAVVSFAHGSNDVSNCIGPFVAVIDIYLYGEVKVGQDVPFWILLCGGLGIVVGLATYGYKVMATVGENIAKLTFTRGYAAQLGTCTTVLTASQLGLSVSTTHVLIGAISGVALVEGIEKINLLTIKRIAYSWVITIPASMFFSILLYLIMKIFL